MSDAYQFWRDALAGKKVTISADHPQPGLYKVRDGKEGPWVPVHITSTAATINGKAVDPMTVWTWCADKPISRADYDYFKEHRRFPGEIGHNSGAMSLAAEIVDAADRAFKWVESAAINDKVGADTCANMRQKLLDLAKKADKERDEKKRPHLEAGRAIDAEYKPLVEQAMQAANTLRDELTKWMRAEQAKLDAELTAKRKAEAAARTVEMPPLPPIEPPRIQAGGQAGRKAGLRTVVRFSIEDYDVLCAEFCQHESVRELILKLATQRAKTGVVVPGLKRTETQEAA